VARCYHLGKPKDAWHLLSRASQAEVGERRRFNESFVFIDEEYSPRDLRVLGAVAGDGNVVFGKVQVSFVRNGSSGQPCTTVGTGTWVQEAGAWRRVRLPRTRLLYEMQFERAHYAVAARTAERWVAADPFSLEAHSALIAALERKPAGAERVGAVTAAVKAALAVNPVDSAGLFLAVTFAEDAASAEEYFRRLSPDDCDRGGAAVNVAARLDPEKRLRFLEAVGSRSPVIDLQEVAAALASGDKKSLATLLTESMCERVRAHLERQRSDYAAAWAVTMAEAWLAIENEKAANTWASYASLRDPHAPSLAELLHRNHE